MVRYLLVLIGCLWQPSSAYLSIHMCSRTELPWMRPQISGRPCNRGFPRLRRSESILIRQASDSLAQMLSVLHMTNENTRFRFPPCRCGSTRTARRSLRTLWVFPVHSPTQLRSIQPAVTGYRVLRISSSCPKNLPTQIFCVGSADRFRRR